MANIDPKRDAMEAVRRTAEKLQYNWRECTVHDVPTPTKDAPNQREVRLYHAGMPTTVREWYRDIV